MAQAQAQCSLNAVGECAHDYTALPGDTLKFELRIDNPTAQDCEYEVEVVPPIAVPVESIGEPTYGYFNIEEETTLEDDCLLVPAGGCLWVTWEVALPEDLNCAAVTMCARLTKKTDEVTTIVKKNLKAGTAQVDVPVKPEVKVVTSQTIAVGVTPDELKSCPNSQGKRSNDITAIQQWQAAAWDDCLGAQFADACDSGYSFIDFIKACVAGEPLPDMMVTLTKLDVAEAIQGVDLDNDGDIGVVETTKTKARTEKQLLQDQATELGLPTSGTIAELQARIAEVN